MGILVIDYFSISLLLNSYGLRKLEEVLFGLLSFQYCHQYWNVV